MKDRRLRMLWNSNAVFVNSGYGIHQKDLLYRFLREGWTNTAQIAFTGLEGNPITLNGLMIYPRMADVWGGDAMLYHGKHYQANVIFSMQDIWTLNPQLLQQIKYWIPYVPIDKDPVPSNVLDKLRFAYKIVTFSKFGQDALKRKGFYSTLIPESVDISIFKPMDKMEMRKEFHLPLDIFLFGQIGANKPDMLPRKGWQQAIDAFKLFHDKHPESAYFYLSNQPGGFDIRGYAHYLDLDKSLFTIDEYMAIFHCGSPEVAKIINCFDVTLQPSATEGFGLMSIQSQACEVPIIVNNCTSMPELVIEGETGEICNTGTPQWSPGDGYIYYPDTNSLYEKMEILYKADRVKMGKAGRKHVIENYNIDKMVPAVWNPFLEELQTEILGPKNQVDNIPQVLVK